MVQKTLIALIFMFNSYSYGACDWKTIVKTNDGYLYTRECHIEVGKSLDELEIKRQQVELFRQSSDYFRQSYEFEKQRSDLWYKEAQDLEKRLKNNKVYSDLEKAAYFTLGVFVMYGAVQAVK